MKGWHVYWMSESVGSAKMFRTRRRSDFTAACATARMLGDVASVTAIHISPSGMAWGNYPRLLLKRQILLFLRGELS